VLVQLVTERTGFHAVSREVFRPRPNVDSALVAFRRREKAVPPGVKSVVEAVFAHPTDRYTAELLSAIPGARVRAGEGGAS
jgi:16S rRNA A1518/A1519 N6-dimethyltransferase RsmA/KsgA/DIM1 with predicted DNA glycosylase/AP lyase activity